MAFATRVQRLRATAADWTAENPILGGTDIGYESDTGKEKHGDQFTSWNDLPYATPPGGGGGGDGISFLDYTAVVGHDAQWNATLPVPETYQPNNPYCSVPWAPADFTDVSTWAESAEAEPEMHFAEPRNGGAVLVVDQAGFWQVKTVVSCPAGATWLGEGEGGLGLPDYGEVQFWLQLGPYIQNLIVTANTTNLTATASWLVLLRAGDEITGMVQATNLKHAVTDPVAPTQFTAMRIA